MKDAMTHRTVEAQTPAGTGQMNISCFPDKLPRLSAAARQRMNAAFVARLGAVLGWSGYA